MRFTDRRDAGRQLAALLTGADLDRPVVLALPRGGVPVAYEVAAALHAPLDVVVVRKIGVPFQPELGVGAVAEGGQPLFDDEMLARLGLSRGDLEATVQAEQAELARRVQQYRAGRPLPDVRGRTVVVVDDGLATGSSARTALSALRDRGAQCLVLAVPVGAAETVRRLRADADEVVCVATPRDFVAVGRWYADFAQTSDAEVVDLLARAGGFQTGSKRADQAHGQ